MQAPHHRIRSCALFAGGLLGAALAAAAEDAVVVTATRVDQPSLEVPASIDRVQLEDIRLMRPQVNLSESLGRVPGIVVQNRQNYAQDLQVISRGFGARASFGIRGLRLLSDGIPASMPDGQGQASNFDLGSAERIEVLRGPFSVLHGNASGGVINVITESGAREPGLSFDGSTGAFGSGRAALKVAAARGPANWVVNASRFETNGYREHSAARRDQLNAKLTLGLDAGTLKLVANAFDSPDTQDPLGLTRAQMAANPRQVVALASTFNTRKSVDQRQIGATLARRAGDVEFEASVYAGERGVRQFLAFAGGLPGPPPSNGGVIDLDRGFGGASLRLTRRATLAGAPLVVTLGGEFERMAERRQGFVNNAGTLGAQRRDEDDTVSSVGLYAQAEWRPAERWITTAGLRLNRVLFRSEDHFIAPGNPDDSGRQGFRAATPVAGVVYRASPHISLYANAGRGFETPTFAELAYRPGGSGLNFDLAASRSRHLEAGAKLVLGTGWRVNAAVFDVQTRDEIVVDASIGGRTLFKNAGRTARRGVELGADASFGDGFDAALAWSTLDATFRDSFSTGGAGVTVPAGNVLPGVPRQSLYAELRWRHAPSGFVAAFEVQHKARVAVDDVNSEFADAWTTGNLAFGITRRTPQWQVTAYLRIDNLTDRRYAGSVIANDGNGRFYEPAPGRNATFGVQTKFAL